METADKETPLVEWQRRDPETGLVEPWLTHPFMDEIKTWNLREKQILETGAGLSTAWWRSRCKWVDSIEANQEWGAKALLECHSHSLTNGTMYCEQINEGNAEDYLFLIPMNRIYDIIVIDGICRTEIVEWGISHLQRNYGGYLFIDNMDQDYVWISPKADELIKPYPQKIFIQPGHTNHEGKPWNSRWVNVPESQTP